MPGGGGRGGRGGRGGSSFNVPPTTVTVTPASGEKVNGRLVRIDDFIVILTDSDGTQRTFRRDGDIPKVEIHDPLQPHKDSAAHLHRQRDSRSDCLSGDPEMKLLSAPLHSRFTACYWRSRSIRPC